jgi:hypothetical protein
MSARRCGSRNQNTIDAVPHIHPAALSLAGHRDEPSGGRSFTMVSRVDRRKCAGLVWARILKGNAEGASEGEALPPNIDGFLGSRKIGPNGQEYVDPATLKYVEASQLTYTVTRPDMYNAIMAIPGYSHELERELGVDKSKGMNSYDYVLTYEAITIDSRMMWRPKSRDGYYWTTFDVFTQGESDYQRWHIDQAYRNGDVTYPFWSNPIPKFITNQGGTTPADLSYVASLPLGRVLL